MNPFRLCLSIILCAVATFCCAQERRPFVGEITYTSMQINTGAIGGTKFDYDGKHEKRTVYRNHDKHEYDIRLHYHRIFLVSQNRCIFYSDETKTGVEFPLVKYFEIGRSNEALGYKQGNSIKETGKSGEVQGYSCEIYEGKTFFSYKENMDKENDVTRELWVSTEFEPDSVDNGSNREFKMPGQGQRGLCSLRCGCSTTTPCVCDGEGECLPMTFPRSSIPAPFCQNNTHTPSSCPRRQSESRLQGS